MARDDEGAGAESLEMASDGGLSARSRDLRRARVPDVQKLRAL